MPAWESAELLRWYNHHNLFLLNYEGPYTLSSDIYSFGVSMAELSAGKPPFYNKKHNLDLTLERMWCNIQTS